MWASVFTTAHYSSSVYEYIFSVLEAGPEICIYSTDPQQKLFKNKEVSSDPATSLVIWYSCWVAAQSCHDHELPKIAFPVKFVLSNSMSKSDGGETFSPLSSTWCRWAANSLLCARRAKRKRELLASWQHEMKGLYIRLFESTGSNLTKPVCIMSAVNLNDYRYFHGCPKRSVCGPGFSLIMMRE